LGTGGRGDWEEEGGVIGRGGRERRILEGGMSDGTKVRQM